LCERILLLVLINLQDLIGGNDLAIMELPTKRTSPGSSGHE
jgi:hypothetical protein